MTSRTPDDEQPLDPAGMLDVLERQQRAVDHAWMRPVAGLYSIWGAAWLGGFLLLWSASGAVAEQVRVPAVAAGIGFAALVVAAVVGSAVLGARMGRGVRGPSQFQGAVYGLSWPLTGAAFGAVGYGLLANGMPRDLFSLYYPAAFALMAGTLYIAGAALWSDRSQLVLGIAILVVGSSAPFFGTPTNYLVMALGGGGAFLIAALVFAMRLRRGTR